MKKTLTILVVLVVLTSLTACGKSSGTKTFTSENYVFSLTIPQGVEAKTVTSPNSDTMGLRMKALDGSWSIEAFDNVPPMSPNYVTTQTNLASQYTLTPITVAEAEGYYFVEATANTVEFSICFPNMTSKDPDAAWGTIWLKVLGHQKDLHQLDIPELTQILDSVKKAKPPK